MNNIAIILRKNSFRNIFRDIVLDSFSNNAISSVLICSGFFQERGKFSASNELISSLRHCRQPQRDLIIVGHYGYAWRKDYDDFCTAMQRLSCCHNVQRRIAKKLNWHSKVFIACDINKNPILSIIGSSNMTSNAFGKNNDNKFNYESDVVLWNGNGSINGAVMDRLSGSNFETEVIVAKYDDDNALNQRMTLTAKIIALQNEILDNSTVG